MHVHRDLKPENWRLSENGYTNDIPVAWLVVEFSMLYLDI